MLVRPESTCCADAGLHLIDDKVHAFFLGDILEALSELSRQMVISTFRLDRLDDSSYDFGAFFFAPLADFGPNIGKTGLVLGHIVLNVVFQRILVAGRLRCRPIKSWEVNLV